MPALFRHTATTWLLLVVPYVLVLTGCQGCRFDSLVQRKKKSLDIDELEKKKKEQPKEDFEFQPLRILPDVTQDARAFVKPGHWITVRNQVRANNFDFQAELFTSATDSTSL